MLNPGKTFKKIGIIKETKHIIVFVELNMLTWLHKASLPGHPDSEALLMLLETYQSSMGALDENWHLQAPGYWGAKH